MEANQIKKKSGLATAGMVLGIIGVVLAFVPIINNVAFVLGVLAVIFGGIALAKKASKGKAWTALVLGVLSIIITVLMQQAFSNAIDEATAPTKTTPASSDQSKTDSESADKTFDGAAVYKKIKDGMTKSEVRDVAGIDPTSCTENEDKTLGKTEYCSYGNMLTDKVTIDVVYSQDKVSSKSKNTN